MVQVQYDFSNKDSRRVGMTKDGYGFTSSLLMSGPQVKNDTGNTTIDILALPEDLSGEESVAEEVEATGVLSDRSPPTASKSKSKSPIARNLGERAESSSPEEEVIARDVEPSKNPADIPHTRFVSRSESQHRNGSQERHNRRKAMADVEDDRVDMWGSQTKRVKPSLVYGKSSQQGTSRNIHHLPAKEPKGHVKKTAASVKVSDDGFKIPVFGMDSPRSQRASQRSSGGTQGSSHTTPKRVFKKPPRVSPPKPPKFKTLSQGNGREGIERTTRSAAPLNKLCVSTDTRQLGPAAFSNAVHIAAEKLGMPDIQFKPPPLSKTTSSLPSTSFDDTSASSPLSSPPSEIEIIDVSPTQKNVEYVTNAALVFAEEDSGPRCPLCKERVDSLFFEEWTGGRRLTIRQQAEFCRAYKKHMAEAEWRKQGFPDIAWECLDERLNKYHHAIDDILQGRRFSFYKNVFEDLVKSGKDKTLRKTLMSGDDFQESIPGYYGSRGARVMADNIMTRFASKLRRLTATDKLISSGGVSGYVNAVLVPELGVLLIKDDMSVDEEKAREVLKNSVDIGNLLNEEEDEVIIEPIGDVNAILDST